MLARQCGRPGYTIHIGFRRPRTSRFDPFYGTSSAATNSSPIWVTEGALRRAFLSFLRRFSQSPSTCERLQSELRKENTQSPNLFRSSLSGISMRGWGDIPPTFSWSLSRYKDKTPTLDDPFMSAFISQPSSAVVRPKRPKGSHYEPPPLGTATFFGSILEPFTAIFSPWRVLPPEAPSAPFSTLQEEFTLLNNRILEGKSTTAIVREYKRLKAMEPNMQLTSQAIIVLFRNLLKLGLHTPVLELLRMENLLVEEAIRLLKEAMEGLSPERRIRITGRLVEAGAEVGQKRFSSMLSNELCFLETKKVEVKRDEDFAQDIQSAKDIHELRNILDSIISAGVTISKDTSQLIACRLADIRELEVGAFYALDPIINVPGSNYIGKICDALCNQRRYNSAHELVLRALQKNEFGLLSDLDMKRAVRTVDSMHQPHTRLHNLWKAMKSSASIYHRDISFHTYSAFLGRATRLKFGTPLDWSKGLGETPLLTMSIEIVLQFTDEEKKMAVGLLSSMLEAWVWSWRGRVAVKPNLMNLEGSIPFMAQFFNVLPPVTRDRAIMLLIERTTTNCLRCGGEVWPLRVIWPLVATLAQTETWRDEESVGLWSLERVLLRKRLAPLYLRYRTDGEIARFVTRHYLPLRMGLTGPKRATKYTQEAEKVMVRLRSLERGMTKFPDLSVFAMTILAFKDTSIQTNILVVDMIYTLHRLKRPQDIVLMLQGLKRYHIQPTRSEIGRLIRLITRTHPDSALRLLELYPDTQYSVFAQFIVTAASKRPSLAIAAYQLLTPPTLHHLSAVQPKIPGRRLPKRKLLTAMAWKFANSPVLSPRQCFKYAQKCFQSMLMLGLDPGPKMGWAIAIAGVERAIRVGIPIKRDWERMKWIMKTVRNNAGPKRASEVDLILRGWEKKVWTDKRSMGGLNH